MYTEQFDTTKWEPLINKMASTFANIAKLHRATCGLNDLKQEAWLALLKANKGFDPNKGVKFITYAYTYVYHELLKYIKGQTKLRGKVRNDTSSPTIESYLELGDGNQSPQVVGEIPSMSGVGSVECRDFLDNLMSDLTEHEKTLVNERFFNDAKVKDIAELTQVSSATISQHLDKTIEKMRRTMRRKKNENRHS